MCSVSWYSIRRDCNEKVSLIPSLNHQIHPTVLLPPLIRGVVRNGSALAEALEGHASFEHVLRHQEVIDGFLKQTDYRFECSEIVGRKFESVEDHAAYLRDGGCSELLSELAALIGFPEEEEA